MRPLPPLRTPLKCPPCSASGTSERLITGTLLARSLVSLPKTSEALSSPGAEGGCTVTWKVPDGPGSNVDIDGETVPPASKCCEVKVKWTGPTYANGVT